MNFLSFSPFLRNILLLLIWRRQLEKFAPLLLHCMLELLVYSVPRIPVFFSRPSRPFLGMASFLCVWVYGCLFWMILFPAWLFGLLLEDMLHPLKLAADVAFVTLVHTETCTTSRSLASPSPR